MKEGEKIRFVRKHEEEIRPLLNTEDAEHIEDHIDSVLEAFETKVMTYHRSEDILPGAQRVILEASMPANVGVIKPLLRSLEADSRCEGVTLLTDNVASKEFKNDETLQLNQIRSGPSSIGDIPAGPYGSALVLDSPKNSPAPFLLESSKEIYNTKRLYFWSLQLFDSKYAAMLGSVDSILTTNEFTAELARCVLDDASKHIIPVGSPLIDAINIQNGEKLREQGRRGLNIPDSTRVIMHSSIVPESFAAQHESPDLNDATYWHTLEGVIVSAGRNPTRDFALILRIHPRMKNTYRFPETKDLPQNLRIVDGDSVSYEEAVYASDVLCCNPLSTEVILAPYRGRQAVVFAYPGKGQFGTILNELYGEKGAALFNDTNLFELARSSEGLSRILDNHAAPRQCQSGQVDSVTKVKELLLIDAAAVRG